MNKNSFFIRLAESMNPPETNECLETKPFLQEDFIEFLYQPHTVN
jgi:hypothetical protein